MTTVDGVLQDSGVVDKYTGVGPEPGDVDKDTGVGQRGVPKMNLGQMQTQARMRKKDEPVAETGTHELDTGLCWHCGLRPRRAGRR